MGRRLSRWASWAAPLAGGLAGVGAGYLVWGLAIEPRRLRVERHVARIPHLPDSWRGRSLALLADPQVGMRFGNEGVVARAVRHVVRARPDAVLLAGDFVLHTTGDAGPRVAAITKLLRPIPAARIPTFAVLGNHDYDHPGDEPRDVSLEDQVAASLRRIGITVLRNDRATVPLPDGTHPSLAPLHVVGLGERRLDDDDPDEAFEGLQAEAPRVVLMHNPDTFRRLPAGAAPFAVAGHTHGAQVRFVPNATEPWWMRLAGMPCDLRHGAGWMPPDFGAPGNRLYVSRGVGFSRAPLRINAPPELTLFTLQPDS
jgi:uncharacterized protein